MPFFESRPSAKKLKIAMVAPPWISIPPQGYGGIENVIHGLVVELTKMGHQVDLFSTGDSTSPASHNYSLYPEGQFHYLHRMIYENAPVAIAQVMFAVNLIRDAGYDVIHDHNGFIGPAIMAYLDKPDFPPALHTYHGPPFTNDKSDNHPDNHSMYRQFNQAKNLYFVCISEALDRHAPAELRSRLLEPVHNGIDITSFPFRRQKGNYFITLARFNRDKGHGLAARLSEELSLRLKMAGTVAAGIKTPRQLMMELANPLSRFRNDHEFRYFSDEVFPRLSPGQIEYIGNITGDAKMEFISRARALLWPIAWDEPFGLVPIEALACGTPVVAMNRGAVPEMIEHGVNGFIANTEAEFKRYMTQVDSIDPAECRRSVVRRFSARTMAQKYLSRYRQIIR